MPFRIKPPLDWPPQFPAAQAPFVVELRAEQTAHNSSVPGAVLLVSPSLRQSGLLREVRGEDLRLLLAVLSCLTPNGTFLATPERAAAIVGCQTSRARARLEKLARTSWQGQALLVGDSLGEGTRKFVPGHHVVEVRPAVRPGDTGTHAIPATQEETRARLDRAVARSRERYGRPRSEVEAQINEFLSAPGPVPASNSEPSPGTGALPVPAPRSRGFAAKRDLALRLLQAGLSAGQAETLLGSYPPERIERQLAWLPLRGARNPAAYLAAAVEGDYHAPAGTQAADGAPEGEA